MYTFYDVNMHCIRIDLKMHPVDSISAGSREPEHERRVGKESERVRRLCYMGKRGEKKIHPNSNGYTELEAASSWSYNTRFHTEKSSNQPT